MAYKVSFGAVDKNKVYAFNPKNPAHPFEGLNPCICGYHKQCIDAADHCLEVIKLRDSGYDGRCRVAWGRVKKKGAVDHIIELWEVRAAYFRAVRLLEKFKSVEDWADQLGSGAFTNDQKEKLRWPKDKQEELVVLYNLRFFFNSEENLCLIDSDFNLAKNKFLDQDKNPGASDIRRQMQAYYLATADFRDAVLDMLTDEFNSTGQVLFWLVREYLQANYKDFLYECQQLGSEPMPLEEVRPTRIFLPWSVINPSEKYKVVDKAVSELMDMMTEKEWDELEDNYGKAQKTKRAPPKKKTSKAAVVNILSASSNIADRPLNKQLK
ncbi:hypothetical protein F4777DRAFT_593017 [Nemania sp. FL0916]|nr:hypothetical protein F4777DRAFT_593017 [Nemania sp. FL0916]